MFDLSKFSATIEQNFNFHTGSGVATFEADGLFEPDLGERIFAAFPENLNWVQRDGQELVLPSNQKEIAGQLFAFSESILELFQNNIPERDSVVLRLETLRIGRSDGTQRQVGSRLYHQDHETYFTVGIDFDLDSDTNCGTRYFPLIPDENYIYDLEGFPVIPDHWKAEIVPSPMVVILNGGVRHFLFPFDRSRAIIHRGPSLEQLAGRRHLAVFITYTLSGLDQSMDLQDLYLPHLPHSDEEAAAPNRLEILRRQWREKLGITDSIHNKELPRRSQSNVRLYDLSSTGLTYPASNSQPMAESNEKVAVGQLRMFNFPLVISGNGFAECRRHPNRDENFLPIGDLARTSYFYDHIAAAAKAIATNGVFTSHLNDPPYSPKEEGNLELCLLMHESNGPLQLLSEQAFSDLIVSAVLIFTQDEAANGADGAVETATVTIIPSFGVDQGDDLFSSIVLLHALDAAGKPGFKEIYLVDDDRRDHLSGERLSALKQVLKQNTAMVCDDGEFPLFAKRIGVNRKLPKGRISLQESSLSRRVLAQPPQESTY